MALFFFHVRRDADLFEDKRGGEFPDLLAAWNWALHDVEQIIDEALLDVPLDHLWLEIHNASGIEVATIPFARVAALH